MTEKSKSVIKKQKEKNKSSSVLKSLTKIFQNLKSSDSEIKNEENCTTQELALELIKAAEQVAECFKRISDIKRAVEKSAINEDDEKNKKNNLIYSRYKNNNHEVDICGIPSVESFTSSESALDCLQNGWNSLQMCLSCSNLEAIREASFLLDSSIAFLFLGALTSPQFSTAGLMAKTSSQSRQCWVRTLICYKLNKLPRTDPSTLKIIRSILSANASSAPVASRNANNVLSLYGRVAQLLK